MKKSSTKNMIAARDIFLLFILKKEDSYGYEILQKTTKISKGAIYTYIGAIYTVLKEYENAGYIKSYWKMFRDTNPRKYFTLNESGKKALLEKIKENNENPILKKAMGSAKR